MSDWGLLMKMCIKYYVFIVIEIFFKNANYYNSVLPFIFLNNENCIKMCHKSFLVELVSFREKQYLLFSYLLIHKIKYYM